MCAHFLDNDTRAYTATAMPNRVAELAQLTVPTSHVHFRDGGDDDLDTPVDHLAPEPSSGGKVKSTSKGKRSSRRFSPYAVRSWTLHSNPAAGMQHQHTACN